MNSRSLKKLFSILLLLAAAYISVQVVKLLYAEEQETQTYISEQNNPAALVDNRTDEPGVFSGDWYGNILGVIEWNGKTRIYYENRGKDRAEFTESTDLVMWSHAQVVKMPQNMFLMQVEDKIMCYTSQENTAYLHADFDPEQGCTDDGWEIYEWKIDGTLPPSYIENAWIQLGRVRGIADQNEGGWGSDDVEYPDPDNLPEVTEAFEAYPYYDAKDWIQDRRGVSIHTSTDGRKWNSRILADPDDADLPGFRGWRNKNEDGIADFYSAVPLPKNRVLVKVFWKEKSRLVDRLDYTDEIDIRRRFRFTGQTTIIPAVIESGRLRITSTEPVIPHDFHERKAHPDIHWATAHDRMEVGQMTPANRIIEKDGQVYIFYQYRDDVHYEGHPDGNGENLLSGIYMYRMEKGEFEELFR